MFPFIAYSKTEVVEHKKMPLACIRAMNASKELYYQMGYHDIYDNYDSDAFDEKERKNIRKTRFTKDLESAFELGRKIATRAKQLG